MAEDTDLMRLDEMRGTMERPKSLDRNDLTGTEDIGLDDVRLPRLAIAQGLSYQMMPDNSQYIEGLKLFEMFNDLTNEVYGRGPMTFVPIRRSVSRIEFAPRDEGGGIIDLNVPAGDPRLNWTTDENGKKQSPQATTYVDFVVLLLRPGKTPPLEPIVLSIKTTNKFNTAAAKNLTSYIKFRESAIYTGLYTVQAMTEKNDSGTFGVPVIKNAGFIPVDTPSGAALVARAKKFHDSLEGKTVVVERETPEDVGVSDAEGAGYEDPGM